MSAQSAPELSLSAAKATNTRVDALVIGVTTATTAPEPAAGVAKAFGRRFGPLLSSLGFKGKAGEVAQVPSGGAVKSPLVVAVGLGDLDEVTPETLRRASANALQAVRNAASVAIALPARDDRSARAVAEGVLLGTYAYERYLGETDDGLPRTVTILTDKPRSAARRQGLQNATVVSAAVNRARDWVNTPAGDLTPPVFAESFVAAASDSSASGKIKVAVWDEERLDKEKCGGVLGVGRGSDSPPRLVQATYKPRRPKAHLALVGKGITFDSGGLSLKPRDAMTTMKCDMAGAAAVLSATIAIAELGLPIQVTCLAPMAENMVSGSATRPGDVLTIRGGTTVEVHNTDAEGRLVLADALVVAGEQQPDVVVDVATLTGAAVVALGDRTAGVLSDDDRLRQAIPQAAESVGEPMWPLPIAEEMRAKVRSSDIADVRQHNPKSAGGALFAAAFLREFVGESRWAHLDIAGPAFNDDSVFDYTPKGGTGVSVRTLVELAGELANGTVT